jgi:hypothetical protein
MANPTPELNALERDALLRVAMRATVSEPYRRITMRLIHRGLVAETTEGFKLTTLGERLCAGEARSRGFAAYRSPNATAANPTPSGGSASGQARR